MEIERRGVFAQRAQRSLSAAAEADVVRTLEYIPADGESVALARCYRAGLGAGAWKTIVTGNYRTAIALRDALVRRNICIGELAAQMLRLPTFTLSTAHTSIDLSVITVSQLGLRSNRTSFAGVHAHAMELGLDLCPPEVGPQLRFQNTNQEVGEYLLIGMKPLPTASGPDAYFVVGNGGADLLIIGRAAGPDLMVASRSRFVFALPR
jgi:hypothetical protein